MDAAQYRAALSLLGWSPADLAAHCGLDVETVHGIERGRAGPDSSDSEMVRRTLEAAGLVFEDGGARLRPAGHDEGIRPEALTTENDH